MKMKTNKQLNNCQSISEIGVRVLNLSAFQTLPWNQLELEATANCTTEGALLEFTATAAVDQSQVLIITAELGPFVNRISEVRLHKLGLPHKVAQRFSLDYRHVLWPLLLNSGAGQGMRMAHLSSICKVVKQKHAIV